MSNALHPFWSLTPEALASQATAPVAATHGDRCICRHCASQSYANELHRNNLLQQEVSRLTERLHKASFARDVERYRYLTMVIEQAVRSGDEKTWAKAVGERMGLGVGVQQAADEAAAKGGV